MFSDNKRLLKGTDLYINQWHAMFLKKFLYTYRNKLLFAIQNFMPIFFVIVTILIARTQGIFNDLKPMTMSLGQYPTVVTILESDNIKPNTLEYNVAEQYKTIANSYGKGHTFEMTGSKNFTKYILDLGETLQVRINARYIAAATVSEGKITAWLNNQPLHSAPLTVNLVHNAMAK